MVWHGLHAYYIRSSVGCCVVVSQKKSMRAHRTFSSSFEVSHFVPLSHVFVPNQDDVVPVLKMRHPHEM
jgi:hypothetical protein